MHYRSQAGIAGYGLPRALFAPDGGAGGGQVDVKKLEGVVADLGKVMKQVGDDLKTHGESFKTELKNLGKATGETTEKVDKAMTELGDSKQRLDKIEQLLARIRTEGLGGAQAKTPGQEVVDSERFKAWHKDRPSSKVRIPVNNLITSITTDADGSAGDTIAPQRLPGIQTPAQRRLTIRALLAPGRTTSNLIQYVQETGFTNSAGPQTGGVEGGAKAESTLKFDLKDTGVKTIAHFVRTSTQVLDDSAQLQSYIDARLRYGLALEEERQLLQGNNVGGNLKGLIEYATAYAAEFTPALPTAIDTIRLAMLQATLAEWPATGIVMHPIDWARIELTKDENGRYLFANPQAITGPTLWGLPVVATQAITVDKFLTGAFTPAAQIFDRQDATVEISTEDADNFTKNLATIRAEERIALAVYRPEALIYGDFGNES
jgi:HK97 family phage major capsid protein